MDSQSPIPLSVCVLLQCTLMSYPSAIFLEGLETLGYKDCHGV